MARLYAKWQDGSKMAMFAHDSGVSRVKKEDVGSPFIGNFRGLSPPFSMTPSNTESATENVIC